MSWLLLEMLTFGFWQFGFDIKECKQTNSAKENEHIGAKFHLDKREELSNKIGANPADNTGDS